MDRDNCVLGLGVYELLDDFHIKPKPWAKIDGKVNAWILMQETIGHKMHAAICFLLGFVALNGVVEGQVPRFEIELIFVSFCFIVRRHLQCLTTRSIGRGYLAD